MISVTMNYVHELKKYVGEKEEVYLAKEGNQLDQICIGSHPMLHLDDYESYARHPRYFYG